MIDLWSIDYIIILTHCPRVWSRYPILDIKIILGLLVESTILA